MPSEHSDRSEKLKTNLANFSETLKFNPVIATVVVDMVSGDNAVQSEGTAPLGDTGHRQLASMRCKQGKHPPQL